MTKTSLILIILLFAYNAGATEYHVAKTGTNFPTIQAVANIAVAGDTITVHEGVYRERVDPINGGTNDLLRIVYRAAEGEKVVIKGSEVVSDWEKVEKSVWKAVVPNHVFKYYNPYSTLVEGDWFISEKIIHHTGEVYINGKALFEQNSLEDVINPIECEWTRNKASSLYVWYAEVDDENTTIWANFQDLDPNIELVEISAREACFYPSEPGKDYITVSGFEMSQAATQWAPPTAEQPGLIGTHWSKGWIIENNIISNAKYVGISLGKDRATGHNVFSLYPEKGGATTYNEVIFMATEAGWSKEKVGSHIIRNNVIFDCGQAGIVGSLGGVFSEIYNNHIYNIYTKRDYTGHEMAGIKLHGSIDVLIEKNRIHNCHCGIWLDWMAQGARVTRNILYDNDQYDYHDEVNHGPLMVDHNLFLTKEGVSTISRSEGTAFVHNLFIGVEGEIDVSTNRQIKGTEGISCGLGIFDKVGYPSYAEGNVFYNGAETYKDEKNSLEVKNFEPTIKLIENENLVTIQLNFDASTQNAKTKLVDTRRLGETLISVTPYVQANGTYYHFDTDFSGNERNVNQPLPGPFENLNTGLTEIKFSQKLPKIK